MQAAVATALPARPVEEPDPQRLPSLVDLDLELGSRLAPEQRDEARRVLGVHVRRLPAGPWDVSAVAVSDPGHLGLLVLEGVIAQEVLIDDVIAPDLLGPGDVIRPWELSPEASLLPSGTRWNVPSDARVAMLDRRVARGLAAHPELLAAIVERMSGRAQRLAVSQAICHLNRIEPRLLALFRHLAERWGRPHPDGLLVPLTLSHRMLAQLIGARRPTVSTALTELARAGHLARLDDGSWLLVRRRDERADDRLRGDVSARLRELREEHERNRRRLGDACLAAGRAVTRSREIRERRDALPRPS